MQRREISGNEKIYAKRAALLPGNSAMNARQADNHFPRSELEVLLLLLTTMRRSAQERSLGRLGQGAEA